MDIATVLADIRPYGMFFTLETGAGGGGWRPAADCYRDGFADLAGATADRYRTTDRRIGASLVHLGHAARLWSPVLACVLAHGVLPDLTSLQRADAGPQLRLPDPVGDPVAGDGCSPDALYDVVVRGHLERFAAGLTVRLPSGLLRGNVASALVGSAAMLAGARPDLRDPVTAMTEALLAATPLAGSGRFDRRGLTFGRRSCCLFYRAPAGSMCGDCALRG